MARRYSVIGITLALVVLAVAGCRTAQPAVAPEPLEGPTGQPPTEMPGEETNETSDLIEALAAAGATVEAKGEIEQAFFSVNGQVLRVNGGDVQVFEYADAAAASAEAAAIAPDGGSIGTTMVTWMDTPHFFLQGNLIVLYVGSDAGVLSALEGVLGPQIAGRDDGEPGAEPGGETGAVEQADALMAALNARDYAQIETMMGETFLVGYWRSEGVSYTPAEAIGQLGNFLPESGELTFTTDAGAFPALDGTPPSAMWGPEANVVENIYSEGWGPDGRGAAILALAQREDGTTFWYALLYAATGFD